MASVAIGEAAGSCRGAVALIQNLPEFSAFALHTPIQYCGIVVSTRGLEVWGSHVSRGTVDDDEGAGYYALRARVDSPLALLPPLLVASRRAPSG